MEIPIPKKDRYTIYSKSGCINCNKVKQLLISNQLHFETINCDEYLFEDKDGFLDFMKGLTKIEYKMFPMVFDSGNFIGGYNETNKHIEKQNIFDSSF